MCISLFLRNTDLKYDFYIKYQVSVTNVFLDFKYMVLFIKKITKKKNKQKRLNHLFLKSETLNVIFITIKIFQWAWIIDCFFLSDKIKNLVKLYTTCAQRILQRAEKWIITNLGKHVLLHQVNTIYFYCNM